MGNITDDHVRELEELFDSGNRAEFYWRYYELSGEYQSVLQAMITTYSGVWGGMAATGNYFAKLNRPDLYTIQLDEFSKHIAESTLDSIKQSKVTDYVLTSEQMLKSDYDAWGTARTLN